MFSQVLSQVVGLSATLSTSAVLAIHISLTVQTPSSSFVRIVSASSVGLELLVLLTLGWLCWTYIFPSSQNIFRRYQATSLSIIIVECLLAAAASVAVLVSLLTGTAINHNNPTNTTQPGLRIGFAVALSLSILTQLLFLACYFAWARPRGFEVTEIVHANESGRLTPGSYVKSIPCVDVSSSHKADTRSWPPAQRLSIGTHMPNSTSSSLTYVVTPKSSRSKLSSRSEPRRQTSMESIAGRMSASDSFDSWDTSAVDASNRKIVLEASSPLHAQTSFLETIPASPATSRCPTPLEPLVPPPPVQYASPDVMRRGETGESWLEDGCDESNIHPLFRSDSPIPPQITTPGTCVIASPDAGRIITPKASSRSLQRMRSGSLQSYASMTTSSR